MNETIMTALAEALTAVTEAQEAATEGRFAEARDLLTIMEEKLAEGEGGNAAHAARRRKILRLEAEVRAVLPDAPEPAAAQADAAEAVGAEDDSNRIPDDIVDAALDQPSEPDLEPADQPVTAEADGQPTEQPAPAHPTPAEANPAEPAPAKSRAVAAPHAYTAEQWSLVAKGLEAAGETAEGRAAEAVQFEAQQVEARTAKENFRAKVFEGQALQARVEAAALAGDVDAANKAWDRLFDVVTAIRSLEGTHRRKNGGVADPAKAAAYDAARDGRLKISQWSQGKGL